MYYHGFYMEKVNVPSGLAYEAVGKVVAVGPEVDPTLIGKRFGTIPGFSMNQYPVLAEEAVVPASVLAAVPDSFSAVEGAAVWMQYCTAYGALVPFGKVADGDFVIITAASSSVGLAAIQIVKAQGGISIAATRGSAKKDQLICSGAEPLSSSRKKRTLVARVQSITHGCSCRLLIRWAVATTSIHCAATANGGTIFLYGMLSGTPTPFPMAAFGRTIGHVRLHLRRAGRGNAGKCGNHEKVHHYDAWRTYDPSSRKIARTFPFDQNSRSHWLGTLKAKPAGRQGLLATL